VALTDQDLRVSVQDIRGEDRALQLGDAEVDCCRLALRAVAARLGIDLAAAAPLPTWTVLIDWPSRIEARRRLFWAAVPGSPGCEGLTFHGGTLVPHLDDFALLCHEAGHWLAWHARGVELASPESERLANRAEGPGWLARLFGMRDPWTG